MSKKKDSKLDTYYHDDKERVNNPPVGMVDENTDPEVSEQKTYQYDPHLDPTLHWAGKVEQPKLEIDTRSLHVHERIDPLVIVDAVKKENGLGQKSLFEERSLPLRKALHFYQHKENWTNRLIAGDSSLIMNSLLIKEGMGGKVQMVYIDPPYGIKYGSNFQPFANKSDVKDQKDEDLTTEPEMIRAFRDTWQLGIHSYLSFIRDRLLLARELLTSSGSCFVQISDKNVHLVRCLMDEVFGVGNFVSLITYKVTSGTSQKDAPAQTHDYIIWYARDKRQIKFHHLYLKRETVDIRTYRQVEDKKGNRRAMTDEERQHLKNWAENLIAFETLPLHSQGTAGNKESREFNNEQFEPPTNSGWRHTITGFNRLKWARRIIRERTTIRSIRYHNDFPYMELTSNWTDTGPEQNKAYVVQTSPRPIERCMLMSTDPGDLVLDPTCGSGTTAFVAEKWGRRWITCDTSRIALTLAKQRLMTSVFDYYKLAHPQEGVGSDFDYEPVRKITIGGIANNPDIKQGMTRAEIEAAIARHAPQETLYDRPLRDRGKQRVTGPFTVEAVPAPTVRSLDDLKSKPNKNKQPSADNSVARSGETLRQTEWRDELERNGIRARGGKKLEFVNMEVASGFYHIHARAQTRAAKPRQVLISFGPEHAPLESRQVGSALREAKQVGCDLLLFLAFRFDPEAAKDIDELPPEKAGMQLLRAEMNTDLMVGDLKKKQRSSDSFWLVGQPDIKLRWSEQDGVPQIQVEVRGFDYYNPETSDVESGGSDKIAMWLLDINYDDRSLLPRQVFFPMEGKNGGWNKLANTLRAIVDREKMEAFTGTHSLPFPMPGTDCLAVKIIDDRGLESMRVLRGLKQQYQKEQGNK